MDIAFTETELAYLRGQRLGRLATVDKAGAPQNNPVGYFIDDDTGQLVIAGFAMGKSRKYRNVQGNAEVSLVVDDIASTDPWRVRGVEVRGTAQAQDDVDPPIEGTSREVIRITPRWIGSWGLTPGAQGLDSRGVQAGARLASTRPAARRTLRTGRRARPRRHLLPRTRRTSERRPLAGFDLRARRDGAVPRRRGRGAERAPRPVRTDPLALGRHAAPDLQPPGEPHAGRRGVHRHAHRHARPLARDPRSAPAHRRPRLRHGSGAPARMAHRQPHHRTGLA